MASLREMREEKNLTQEDVATAIGVSRIAVHKWEIGRNAPNAKYLSGLASLFECSVDDILRLYE